jgi:putative heme-binding domain-containing protein
VLSVAATRPQGGYAVWQYEAVARLLDEIDRQKTTLAESAADAESEPEFQGALQQVGELLDAAWNVACDEEAALDMRLAALRVLGRGLDRPGTNLDPLARLLVPQSPIDVQLAVAEAMGRTRDERVPGLLLAGWAEQGPKVNTAIVDVLLSRSEWAAALLDHVEEDRESAIILGTTRRDMLLRYPVPSIRERAQAILGGVTTSEAIERTLEKHAPVLEMTGEPVRGKELFVETTCGDCHLLDGVGNEIATDLRTLVDTSPGALLVALVDPNRAVEDKYVEYTAVTTDGLMLSGMLLEETTGSVMLADTAGKRHTLLRRDLEELVSTGRSHMPEGLEAKMDFHEMADLFAFIAQAAPPCREVAGNNPHVIEADYEGCLDLPVAACEIYGPRIKMGGGSQFLVWFYDGPADRVVWSVDVPAAGTYDVWIEWAQIDEYADNPIAIEVEGTSSRLVTALPSTGGWGNVRREKFGLLELESGRHRIHFRPNGPTETEVSDLRGLRLVPVQTGK